MRSLSIVLFLSAATWCVVPAWAQFGLYGSPEALRLPAAQPAATPYGSYQAPGAYPATSAPRPLDTFYAPARPLSPGPYVQPVAAQSSTSTLGDTLPLEPAANPAPVRTPSVVNQMLGPPVTDQGGGFYYENTANKASSCGCGNCGEGVYSSAVGRFQQAACGPECGNCCDGAYCCPWYGGANALIMTRDKGNRVWTSYLDQNEPMQLANTDDVAMDWHCGMEVRFGRRFCCDQWAIEATYWTLFPSTESFTLTGRDGFGLATPLNDREVEFNGITADDWFGNGALEHRLSRRDEFHNVEINAIRNRFLGGCNTPCGLDWLAGFRFFRFEDNLTFASVQNGGSWAQPDTVAYLEDRVANNLWGFQIGFNADYCLAQNLRVFLTPKFGIYDNHISHYFSMHLGDGTLGTGVYGSFPVDGHTDVVSFLTQIDLGLDWRFAENWSARIGYRVVKATGIGLAESQIPQYLVDLPEISHVKTNGDLVLHGAYAGLTYSF